MCLAAIGVFDSGAGGLSVVQALQQRLPHENIIYIADNAYAPYGQQSVATIVARAEFLAQELNHRQAKALVVACNTATVNAINTLREQLELPIIGVEPGIKPAVANSKTGVIGVIATTQTINSANFAALISRNSGSCKVLARACPGLVELIERGQPHSRACLELLREYLQPLIAANIDQLVLGCTHYIFAQQSIKQVLAELAPRPISLVNTAAAVANECARRLAERDLLASSTAGHAQYWCTGAAQQASQIYSQLMQQDIKVQPL